MGNGAALSHRPERREQLDPAGRLSEAPSKDGTATVAEEEARWRRRGLRHRPGARVQRPPIAGGEQDREGLEHNAPIRTVLSFWSLPRPGAL